MEGLKSFIGILGDNPRIKILEYLVIGRNFEYNISDIANGSNISRPTCYVELNDLIKKNIVIKGKKYKGRQCYKLNKRSQEVRIIIEMWQKITYKNTKLD